MKKNSTKAFLGKAILSLFVFSLLSCFEKDDFNFDKFSGAEWTGSYALPLINSSLTIKDLINDEDSARLKEKPDGLIYLEYDEKVESYDIRDEFKLPSRSFSKAYALPNIKLPSLANTATIAAIQVNNKSDVAFTTYPDVVSVTYSQGNMTVTAQNKTLTPITALSVRVFNKVDGTIVGTSTFGALPSNGATAVAGTSIPLAGKIVKKDLMVRVMTITPATVNANSVVINIASSSDAKASEGQIILQEDVVISATEPIDFELTPEQLQEFVFKAGTFSYTIDNDINYRTEAAISLPSIKLDGAAYSNNVIFTSATTQTANIPLVNYKTDLTTLTPAYNRFPLKIDVICRKSATPFIWRSTDRVTVDAYFTNLDYTYLKGFFGNKTIPLEENYFEISAFEKSLNGINMSFVEPKISFTVDNGYGVPIKLNFKKFQAEKDNVTKNFLIDPASPFDINSPAIFGDKATSTTINVTNVNEIYNLSPTKIIYQVDGILNNGVSSGSNFLTDTSKVVINMHAEIPLHGRASGIELNDTTENSLSEDIDEVEIETIKLKAVIKNEFPIDAKVQIYFATSNYIITDSLFTPAQTALVIASTVDANGDIVKAGNYDQVIEVNKEKFERLLQSPNLIIKAKMETAEGGQKDVKIKSQYKLDIKLGVQTKLNIKIKS